MIKTVKKISRPAIIAIVIISILLVSFAIFLPIYLKNNQDARLLYEGSEIKIVAYGEEIGIYTMEEILEIVDVEDFIAIYDTSSSDPVEKTYTGIELKELINALDINLQDARTITFKASDGVNKLYSQQDVVQSNNVFIAFKVEGEYFNLGIDPLASTKTAEDGGPFVVIKVSDIHSQSRCKMLVEIVIE